MCHASVGGASFVSPVWSSGAVAASGLRGRRWTREARGFLERGTGLYVIRTATVRLWFWLLLLG